MKINSWAWRPKCYGTISLCMIMRNEEKLLARCLNSVRALVDEIIIVDTGSTDRSVEIAKSFGAVVLRDPWQDDFARPRNIGLSVAKCDWILVMDPDEVLAVRDHYKLRELTNDKRVVAYQMDTRNYTQNRMMQGFHPNVGDYAEGNGWPGYTPSCKGRFFRNGLGFKFVGRWHEMVDASVDVRKYGVAKVVVPVHHYAGEICQGSDEARRAFYLRMGEKKVADDPDNDQAWWELGVAEGISGLYARAARSILLSMRKGFYTADRLFQLVHALRQLGLMKDAGFYFEKAICKLYPNLTHCEERLRSSGSLVPHFLSK